MIQLFPVELPLQGLQRCLFTSQEFGQGRLENCAIDGCYGWLDARFGCRFTVPAQRGSRSAVC